MDACRGPRPERPGCGKIPGLDTGAQHHRILEPVRRLPDRRTDHRPGQQSVPLHRSGQPLRRSGDRTAQGRHLRTHGQQNAFVRLPCVGDLQQNVQQHAYHQPLRRYVGEQDRPAQHLVPRLGTPVRYGYGALLRLPGLQTGHGERQQVLYDRRHVLPGGGLLLQRDLFLQGTLHHQRNLPLRRDQQDG